MPEFKQLLPYGTYTTFKNTVERFVNSTVPTSINRHVLDDVSGGEFSALASTLKFLGLMNSDQTLKPEFKQLVDALAKNKTEYESVLLNLMTDAYKPVLGNFDIEAGTLPDLEKKFRDAGMPSGQMLTKAIRFYIKAQQDCGVPVSEHITKPRPRTRKPKDQKARKPEGKQEHQNTNTGTPPRAADTVPSNCERQTIPFVEGGFIQYPKNLTETDVTMFEAMISVLRTYAKSREGSEGKKKGGGIKRTAEVREPSGGE